MAITDAYVKPAVAGSLDLTVGNTLPEDWLDTMASNVLHLYNRSVVELVNRSGVTLQTGDVVIYDTSADSSITRTTTADDPKAVGVIVDGPVLNLATARVVVRGLATVNVTGATARGDRLSTSTTAGSAKPNTTPGADDFAVAMTAVGGAGTVTAYVIGKPIGIQRFPQAISMESTLSVTGAINGQTISAAAVFTGTASFAGALTVNATGSVFSAGTNAATNVTIGGGGSASSQVVSLTLNAPSAGGTGAANIPFQRSGVVVWTAGIDGGASGAKSAVTDFFWHNGSAYVAALSTAGLFTAMGGLSVPNNTLISSKTSGGTIRSLIAADTSNYVQVGDTASWAGIKFYSGAATAAATIDSSGNVGIGGSPITGAGRRLSVYANSTAPNIAAEFVENAGVHSVYIRPNTSSVNLITSDYISGGVYRPLALSARENVSDFVIDTSGKISIGGTSIASKLHVEGTANDRLSQISSTGTSVASVALRPTSAGLTFLTDTAGFSWRTGANINLDGNQGTERLALDSSGNLIQAGGYHSIGASPAASGTIRLANGATIKGLNNAGTADIQAVAIGTAGLTFGDRNNISGGIEFALNTGNFSFTSGGGTTKAVLYASGCLSVGPLVDRGAGTVDVSGNVFKNGSAYTNPDFLFELAFTGQVKVYRNDTWHHYQSLMGGSLWSIGQLREYVSTHYRFPMITGSIPNGLFTDETSLGRDDVSLMLHEQAYLFLFDHEDRIKALETRPGPWLKLWSAADHKAQLAPASALEMVRSTPVYTDGSEAGLADTVTPMVGSTGSTQSATAIAWGAIQALQEQLAKAQATIHALSETVATLQGGKH